MILIVEIGHHEVGQTVARGVPRVDSHPSLGRAVFVIRYLGINARVFEDAVPPIDEEQIGRAKFLTRREETNTRVKSIWNSRA